MGYIRLRSGLARSGRLLQSAFIGSILGASVLAAAGTAQTTLVTAGFGAGASPFSYADDAFGTTNPGFASGVWESTAGVAGGGLHLRLGGVNNSTVGPMSGAWLVPFTLTTAGDVRVDLSTLMVVEAGYEPDECSEVRVAIDGVLVGPGGSAPILAECGSGTQAFYDAIGLSFEVPLAAGAHTLAIGAWASGKNATNEVTHVFFDNVSVTALAVPTGDTLFTDQTGAAGLDYTQSSAPDGPEVMTGGAAVGDADGDGDLDLFVTRNDAPDIMFSNNGDGTFTDLSDQSGLGAFDLTSNGCGFADIDNDGDQDLYVTTLRDENRFYLFINNGIGGFTEEAVTRGADLTDDADHLGFGVAFGDYDKDGYLDIFTAEWRNDAFVTLGLPSHTRLLHNLGEASPGFFEDVTVAADIDFDDVPETPGTAAGGTDQPPGSYAFAPAFVDLDGDGWLDIAMAADFGTSRIWWNDGDGTFTDGSVAAGVGSESNGMGSTFGDFDRDGDMDWFVTSIYVTDGIPRNGNRLYSNNGDRTFADVTTAAGVRNGYWGWGTGFLDCDNDGDLDIVQTNGFPMPQDGDWTADPMRLWRNDGSAFTETAASEGITDTRQGKGLLVFDYDDDGDVDVFVCNNNSGPVLYRNELVLGSAGFLRVVCEGTASPRDGHGAVVRMTPVLGGTTHMRQIGAATHFLSQSERVAHFGLGAGSAPVASVEVLWPTGEIQTFTDVARNTTLTAVEPGEGPPDPDPAGWVDLGGGLASTTGLPAMTGTGTLVGGAPITLSLGNALPGAAVTFVLSDEFSNTPLNGGTLFPLWDILINGTVTAGGTSVVSGPWPTGLASGYTFWFQAWIVDPGGPEGWAASNGLRAVQP